MLAALSSLKFNVSEWFSFVVLLHMLVKMKSDQNVLWFESPVNNNNVQYPTVSQHVLQKSGCVNYVSQNARFSTKCLILVPAQIKRLRRVVESMNSFFAQISGAGCALRAFWTRHLNEIRSTNGVTRDVLFLNVFDIAPYLRETQSEQRCWGSRAALRASRRERMWSFGHSRTGIHPWF